MIDLTAYKCSAGIPALMSRAAIMEPVGQGVSQRLGRVGDRFRIDFTIVPMELESDGRRAIADLQMAQAEGGRVIYPQPGFAIGTPGAPTVDGAHTGGTALAITGATPHYAVRKGQALNLIVSGRYYLYFAAANAILDENGAGTVTLTTPMRKHMAGGETVVLAKPVIEGWLDGNERNWTIDNTRTVGLQFTVTERG